MRPERIIRMIPALLRKLDPGRLLQKKIHYQNGILRWDGRRFPLRPDRSVYVLGAGKGSARMAQALEEILGGRGADGIVVTKYGYAAPCKKIRVVEAGHPIPDAAGERAARKVLALADRAGEGDLVIGLWSGGGSALLPAPLPGITLRAERKTTDLLLKSGATIEEINTVRKHLSRIKGGRLAERIAPAAQVHFILSDVVGDRLDRIASGPTVSDPTTFSDAIDILNRYTLWTRIDRSVRALLEGGRRGRREETPKPGGRFWRGVENLLIGNGALAAREAARLVAAEGFRPRILTSLLEGEAREAAKVLVALGKEELKKNSAPVCLLAGGETTVTVRGKGRGGRCQEFALSAAIALAGEKGLTAAAFSTDGTDGPTDAAGAVADGGTLRRAARLGWDARRALDENNAYSFFNTVGGLIRTGPTRTHLNDLYLIFVA